MLDPCIVLVDSHCMGETNNIVILQLKLDFKKGPGPFQKKKKKTPSRKWKEKPTEWKKIFANYATDLFDIQNIFLKTLATQQ